MEEVSGPVIAIAIILAAVFVPTAFIPGITGQLYQQFAVTIAVSVIISAFNALTLSPALCALLLKPKVKGTGPLQKFYDWFNRVFGRATDGYVSICGAAIRKSKTSLLLLARSDRPGRGSGQEHSNRLPPRRGPGLHLRQYPAPQLRFAAADQ